MSEKAHFLSDRLELYIDKRRHHVGVPTDDPDVDKLFAVPTDPVLEALVKIAQATLELSGYMDLSADIDEGLADLSQALP